MAKLHRTEMGGRNELLESTQWSQIVRAGQGDTDERRQALGAITEQYWKPVYSFFLRKGFDNERAKDLTQGFFTDVILGRGLIGKADPSKGKFRSFLLKAATNYAEDCRRRDAAAIRSPDKPMISLEGLDGAGLITSPTDESPDQAFNRAWASALLGEVLADVEAQCRHTDQRTHWAVFQARVLRPITDGAAPVPYADLCKQLGIARPDQAATMNTTVKHKFEATLRRHVRQWVESDGEVAEEIADLMAILSTAHG